MCHYVTVSVSVKTMDSYRFNYKLFKIFYNFYIHFGTFFGYLPLVTNPKTQKVMFGSKSSIIRSVLTIFLHFCMMIFSFMFNSITPNSMKSLSVLDRIITLITGFVFNASVTSISVVVIKRRKLIQKARRGFFALLRYYKDIDINFKVKNHFLSYFLRKACLDFGFVIIIEIVELSRASSIVTTVFDLCRFLFNNLIYSFASMVFYASLLFAGYGIETITVHYKDILGKSEECNKNVNNISLFSNNVQFVDFWPKIYEKTSKFVQNIGLLFQINLVFFSLTIFVGLIRSVSAVSFS